MFLQRWPVFFWLALVFILTYLYAYPFDIFSRIDSYYTATDMIGGIWAFDWKLTQLASGQWGKLFSGNVFYPLENSALLNENPLSSALLSVPLYWVTQDSYLCYQWSIFSSYLISALGMFLLSRNLKLDVWGAILSSLIFSFCGYRYGVSPYVHQSTMQWMPFVLLFTHKYFEGNKKNHLYWAALFYCLQATASALYLILFSFFVLCFVSIIIITKQLNQWRKFWVDAIGPVILVLIIVAWNYIPYWKIAQEHHLARGISAQAYYGASLLSFFHLSQSYFLENILSLWRPKEGIVSPGITATFLTLGMAWILKKEQSSLAWIKRYDIFLIALGGVTLILWQFKPQFEEVTFAKSSYALEHPSIIPLAILSPVFLTITFRLFLTRVIRGVFAGLKENRTFQLYFLLAFLAFLVSLGPIVKTFPEDYLMVNPLGISLYYLFPGWNAVRAISRVSGFIPLCFGITAGMGFMFFRERLAKPSSKTFFLIVVLTALLLELYPAKGFNMPYTPKNSEIEPEYIWLKEHGEKGAIFEWPPCEYCNARYMERSIFHKKNLVNGYASWYWDGIHKLIQLKDPSTSEALKSISAFGIKYLVVHKELGKFPEWAQDRIGKFYLVGRFEDALIYKDADAQVNLLPDNYVENFSVSQVATDKHSSKLCFVFNSPDIYYVSLIKRILNIELQTIGNGPKHNFQIPFYPTLWRDQYSHCMTLKIPSENINFAIAKDSEEGGAKRFSLTNKL